MITLGVRLEGFSALAASLGQQARQIPFAASLALNATARSVRTATLAKWPRSSTGRRRWS
jgi:hypothetical protein